MPFKDVQSRWRRGNQKILLRKKCFFHDVIFRKVSKRCFIFASICHQRSSLFRHRFSHRFVHRFLIENDSKTKPQIIWGGDHFGTFFATFSEGRLLDAFWSSLLTAPGSLLAPLGSLLAPLAHFWHPLAFFWLTLGALSFIFAYSGFDFVTFAVSCLHFSYLFEIYMKISCKI